MTSVAPTKTPKKLQFNVMQEEYEHFAELASDFAGGPKGSKVKFLRELIYRYEVETEMNEADDAGRVSIVADLKRDLMNRELRLTELSRERDELRRHLTELQSAIHPTFQGEQSKGVAMKRLPPWAELVRRVSNFTSGKLK